MATTPRLVQRQVSVPPRRRDAGAVDPNDIAFRIDPSALLEDDLGITSTRPSLIKTSQARREAMPAWARTF